MSDYDPPTLAAKWGENLPRLLSECQNLWEQGRSPRRWFNFGLPEADAKQDRATPRRDLRILHFEGRVVFGHFARAFFPAYIPGRATHYGSVVYAEDASACQEVFELAWRVNELRHEAISPAGTERVAAAIRDDRSSFSRVELPDALGVGKGRYFANLGILRSRLPKGYIHTRLVPILIQPASTSWCCLLPLRFWGREFVSVWESGPPSYEPEAFSEKCREFGIVA